MSNEVSTIVPTAKSERVVYVVQRLFMNDVWVNLASFPSINDAKKCLEMRSVGKKKYRIIKRITIQEVM